MKFILLTMAATLVTIASLTVNGGHLEPLEDSVAAATFGAGSNCGKAQAGTLGCQGSGCTTRTKTFATQDPGDTKDLSGNCQYTNQQGESISCGAWHTTTPCDEEES